MALRSVAEVWDDWKAVVNMTAKELEDWLKTQESEGVGDNDSDSESTGHESGRRIVRLLRASNDDLDEDDAAHMRKVVVRAPPPRTAPGRGRVLDAVAVLADELGPRPAEGLIVTAQAGATRWIASALNCFGTEGAKPSCHLRTARARAPLRRHWHSRSDRRKAPARWQLASTDRR